MRGKVPSRVARLDSGSADAFGNLRDSDMVSVWPYLPLHNTHIHGEIKFHPSDARLPTRYAFPLFMRIDMSPLVLTESTQRWSHPNIDAKESFRPHLGIGNKRDSTGTGSTKAPSHVLFIAIAVSLVPLAALMIVAVALVRRAYMYVKIVSLKVTVALKLQGGRWWAGHG